MSIEATLTALINPLVGNRIWWDTMPDGYIITQPVVIAQQVGGEAFFYVENARPDHRHARIQLSVWGKTRASVNAVSRQLEDAIAVAEGLKAQPYNAFTSLFETDLRLYGNQQQFGFWYNSP